MQNIYNLLRAITQDRGLQMTIKSDYLEPILQYKDALQTILYNLALNAILYSDKGTVHISCTVHHDLIIIAVKDEGAGMPAEKVNELTGMTKKGARNNELSNQGQGFGYLIIRDLLKLIAGTLSIESKVGSGTKIEVCFKSLE